MTPCVAICKVVDGVCVGCNRTLEEIGMWSKLSDEEKRKLMEELPHRIL